ncbi:hypothetical protein [Paenibacillus sp. NAIST15-1]|uniref:hypothetical protein n=1 Tax=Paenibacillus sp. NAIST15-1 TaxID=1605994 RepID=UPI00086A46AA|nr:hypothetical protein [Paenibacillus sp. NAIST15-1]GAV11454.1 hypothetical protein PBN151_1383 [Paenibacillus sp. NAIST15-1]
MKGVQEIIDFFECGEGYEKNEIIENLLGEIKSLNGYSADEIGLEWDGKTLMVLDDFTNAFYDKLIASVCNVIRSFEDKEEEES